MRAKEYIRILDALQMTGVYVIREEDRRVLYYNEWIKKAAPDIEEGAVCSEVLKGICEDCPLLHIGTARETHYVSYSDYFGKAIRAAVTRILWEDEIPAFVITVTPYAEEAEYKYRKVLLANLSTDSFNIMKADEDELQELGEYLGTLSGWLEGIVTRGYIYIEDTERFQEFIQVRRLKEELGKGRTSLSCIYRRRAGGRFKWHTMEIVPSSDYTDENQKVMIYVKDVHDIFKEGLQREETNIWNQEIINSLGEMNFAIYVADLQTGSVHIVRTTEKVQESMKSKVFLWDQIFENKGANYIAAEDIEEFEANFSLRAMRQAWKNGEKKRTFVCRALLYGLWRYISVTAYFKENQKQGGYAILTFQDVDEKNKKELERTQTDQRMAAIIKSRYSILSTVDLETGVCERIFLAEDSPHRRVKGDYSSYIQRALEETVAETDKEQFKHMFLLDNLRKKAQDVQEFKEELYQYQMKGPKARWLEQHVLYLRQGNKIAVNILGRDITDEKLAEENARMEMLEKASIINSLSSMFFATYFLDLAHDSFRPVTQKNEVGSILGSEKNYTQAIRMYAEHFICEEDRKEYLEHLDVRRLCRTLSREHPLTAFEYRMLTQDGGRRWTRATVVLAETADDGRPKRALYAAQDVTESKLKEEREQQALKEACKAANHANAAKSEFMSRMSHDIRTPMNAIIGMTAIAGRYLDDKERVADCLGKITVSSRHLLSLINEVLDMSKIESGKIDLAEEDINLSDLIGNLVTMVRPAVQEKEHNFNVRIAHVEHEHVIGDSMRVQQVFINILGNSIKYTPPGGNIDLEIREKPSSAYDYGFYEFVFRDNGMGMSREFQKKLFEPFSRAEDSRVNKIEGTGLGMTIVKNIVRRMNGDITVESEPGKGTQFTVTLSLRLADTEAPDTEKLADLPVLVADDDETACSMTCLILEKIGMKGEYVLSGKEAVARVWEHHLAQEDYFAVILDWKMPEMDGVQTARAIREKVGSDVSIIVLSAYDWSSIEDEARSAGVDGFISKPLFQSRLVYLFNQIVESDKTQAAAEKELLDETKLSGRRVLLAEDNELNREIAVEIISQTGVLVESVEDGREALERFEQMGENYYDMIFMDIQMPVMNGYEAASAIRKLPRADAAAVPIIAMTADAFAEDIRQSKKAGMNEHLTKPLDIKQLLECLEHWLGGSNQMKGVESAVR